MILYGVHQRFLRHPSSYQRLSLCIQISLLLNHRFSGSSSSLKFSLWKMQSGGPESASPITNRVQSLSSAETRGKHRVHAEVKRLEQEARFLEEELEQLERMDKASAPCKETLNNVETRPDPLLPSTIGPLNPSWDRWFEGPQESKGCRCWIL
ncbi:Guanine nucleotide-binding protein subunit gamma 2 [Stylosanthes scabra]|uniref:Guanine nucleotide-binding protein subunit gamma 2 n=2 Tax=Stylosanthes scabra TaxID=79078 RepID=A0ABU6TB81_9FABA|nr:Guanine nucleotide-binding protein subunit gamma 2 [Stylosanthes scabra]